MLVNRKIRYLFFEALVTEDVHVHRRTHMFTNVLRSVFAFFFGREFDVIVEHASVGKETED